MPTSIFFYALSEHHATRYNSDDEDREMLLLSYSFSGKLLDLRQKNDRKKLINLVKKLKDDDNCVRLDVMGGGPFKENTSKLTKYKCNGKRYKELKKSIDAVTTMTTTEDVLNDAPYDGLRFWNQNCSDFTNGIILRNELERLGYDGFIVQDGNLSEVGLLNPAKKLKEKHIYNLK